MVSDIVMWVLAVSFAVVSLALTARLILECYLEYIQVKEQITLMREDTKEDDDDYLSY